MGVNEGTIHSHSRGDIFEMAIDRPLKLNGFTPKMFRELLEAYRAYEDDPVSRCAVVTAKGDHFTAGLDLPEMKSHLSDEYMLTEEGEIDLFGLRPPYRSKPIIYAVKGICFTLGIELMLGADFVIAASNTRFAQIEVRRGLMPTGGATTRMVSRAGWGNAMRYLLTGDEFNAETARSFGFVQEVVDFGKEHSRALSLARRISDCAPLAVKAVIENARSGVIHGEVKAHGAFGSTQRGLVNTEDFEEGIKSFQEKRDANFQGK